MYDKQTFANQLNSLMAQRGLLRRDLAEIIGTSDATISRYASGLREPDLRTVVRISEALHVPINELLGVDIPEPIAPPVDIAVLTACYDRASDQDRDVIWTFLARYMTPEEKASITALRMKQEGQVG